MSGLDLASIGPGFADPALGSQSVFRSALQALSRPGLLVRCAPGVDGGAAVALALALLDQDTSLWTSPSARRFEPYLRFHTGCPLVADPAAADFLLVGKADELPPLERLGAGSDEAPHRSATAIVEVAALSDDKGWRLAGPGVTGTRRLRAEGLHEGFAAEWQENAGRFPRGVDLFLCAGELVCGLPRTTQVEG